MVYWFDVFYLIRRVCKAWEYVCSTIPLRVLITSKASGCDAMVRNVATAFPNSEKWYFFHCDNNSAKVGVKQCFSIPKNIMFLFLHYSHTFPFAQAQSLRYIRCFLILFITKDVCNNYASRARPFPERTCFADSLTPTSHARHVSIVSPAS